jgi:hypothetical protein
MAANQQIDLGFRPRRWQVEAFGRMKGKRFGVEVVHRRAGKTVKAIALLVDRGLRCERERGRYAYIAPLLKQAKGIAWDYLKHYALKVPGTQVNESELWVEFPNGARIRLFGADNPDALRGLYFDGVVLDEPAQMKLEVWGEIVQPALADRKGWALFIGTPKGVNLFSDLYYKALANPAEWYAGSWNCYETDALDADEIERLKRELTDAQFRQEMLCDFSASTDDTLIPLSLAQEASTRTYKPEHYEFAARVMGVDVARFGGDRSVIFKRQGLAALKPRVWQGIDTMTLAGAVAEEITRWKPDAVFIDASPASYGVIDRLQSLGHSVIAVDFGGKPGAAKYLNKRSEMWHGLALWLEQGGALPDMPDLKADLCAPMFDYANAAGKMALESKDKIKERLGASPDLGDALALTFAFDVAPSHRVIDGAEVRGMFDNASYLPANTAGEPYNPFG